MESEPKQDLEDTAIDHDAPSNSEPTPKQPKKKLWLWISLAIATLLLVGGAAWAFASQDSSNDVPPTQTEPTEIRDDEDEPSKAIGSDDTEIVAESEVAPEEPAVVPAELKYLEIPEWGFKIAETKNLKGLSYKYAKDKTYVNQETAAYHILLSADITYEPVIEPGEQCDSLIHIERFTPDHLAISHFFNFTAEEYGFPLINGYYYVPMTNPSCPQNVDLEKDELIRVLWTKDEWRGSEMHELAKGIKPI